MMGAAARTWQCLPPAHSKGHERAVPCRPTARALQLPRPNKAMFAAVCHQAHALPASCSGARMTLCPLRMAGGPLPRGWGG